MGKISDCAYKQEHNEERGIWFLRPDAPEFEHHKNINAIISDNAYKKKAQEMKGKVHIPHDLAEYARINKLQSEISDVNYKKGLDHTGVKMSFESLGLEHNAKAQELFSKKLYTAKYEAEKGKYKAVESDPSTEMAKYAQQLQSKQTYTAAGKKVQQAPTNKAVAPVLEHDQKVQKSVSNFEYKKEVRENTDKDFHVVTDTPQHVHAVNIGKVVNDSTYKTTLKAKDHDFSKTPRGQQVKKADKLQSDLEYKKEYNEEIKGKGWKFTKDTPVQRHVENISKVQSDYTYTKDHRENKGKKHSVAATDRPDIKHALSRKDVVSDNQYQKKYKEDINKGYTVTAETPLTDKAIENSFNQSETLYRRKFDYKGKAWQVEESPQIEHYKEVQKLTDNKTYKKGAKENNAMGTMFGLDKETPEFTYQKDAQKLVNNKLYKADYEKETKGQGLTFDLHGTPMMQHIKQAELIKSERAYKKDYVENQLGKPTGMLTNTLMKTAAKASDILSDIKYKRDAVMGEASSILDTPEMRKVKLTANSQIVLDTPELRRVRKSQRNISNAKYKDEIKLNTAFAGLDTPAMRLAKKNKRNYSKVNYEADKQYLKGKVTCVANDLITQHIRHAEDLRDDRVYKGLVAGKTAAAMTRQAQEETWAMWESQHRPPARSHSALGHRPSTAAAQYHQAAAHRQESVDERPSSVVLINKRQSKVNNSSASFFSQRLPRSLARKMSLNTSALHLLWTTAQPEFNTREPSGRDAQAT